VEPLLLTDRTLTFNGLSPLTQTEKHAFGLELMVERYSDSPAEPFGQTPRSVPAHAAPLRLRRFGLGDGAARGKHDLSADLSGAHILRPAEIMGVTPDQVRAGMADQAKRDLIEAATERVLTPDEMLIFKGLAPPKTPTPEGRTSIPSDPPELKIARHMRDLAERYHEMIIQETVRAVPEATVRARATMIGDAQPGTFVGEAMRSASMFKSFGVTVAQLHIGQVIREHAAGWKPGSAGFAAALAIGLPIGGALAIQLKAIRDGRDPDSTASADFWMRAMAQGGGWGIFGDFVLADTNRMGGAWGSTVAGPLVGRAENIWNLTAGNVRQLATDKNTNFGREATKFVGENMPFVNLPYTKLAWQRLFIDRLQMSIDPQAHRAFRRQEDLARQKGSGFYWGPGKSAPDRAPTFGRMFTPPPVR
jgi:hypothetical protein